METQQEKSLGILELPQVLEMLAGQYPESVEIGS